MKTEQYIPVNRLKPFIKNFMFIESEDEIENLILPNTSMVMSLRYKGHVSENNLGNNLPDVALSGIRKTARLIHYSKGTANLLVVFNEGGTTAFSKIPAHELFGLSISSENIFLSTELNELLEQLSEANTNRDRVSIIEAFLLRKLSINKPDLLINSAIQLIKQQSGIIRIKDLTNSLDISQDAFEKRFRKMIGSTPKQYASIIRLRNIINTYQSYSSLTEVSYEAGYFDQSHFIKDFRIFTGQSPKDFFKISRYW